MPNTAIAERGLPKIPNIPDMPSPDDIIKKLEGLPSKFNDLSTAFDRLKDNLKREIGDALVDYVKGKVPIMGLVVAGFFVLVLMLLLANFTARGVEKMLGKLWKHFWAFFKHTRVMRWIAETWLRAWTAICARFSRGRMAERHKHPGADEYQARRSVDTNFEMTRGIGARGHV